MRPARVPLTLTRGDTFKATVTFYQADGTTHADKTGWTFAGQVRSSPDNPTVLATMSASAGDATGIVSFSIVNTATAVLAAGRRAYDMQQTGPDGTVYTFAAGPFDVLADVTRSGP